MGHLTDIEILNYANISRYDAQSKAALKRVNSHIIECAECRKKVRRAAAYLDAVKAMSDEDFSPLYDLGVYDIDEAEAAREAASVAEQETSYNY